jgi:hypothetical protein
MKLQHSKDIRIILDENGDELLRFSGTHLSDLFEIMRKVNHYNKDCIGLRNNIKNILGWDDTDREKLRAINNVI